jgi:hypothetical protein
MWVLVVACLSAPAFAQTPPPEEEALDPADQARLDNDDPENPEVAATAADVTSAPNVERSYTKATFPAELIFRPMTLLPGQAQFTLDLPYVSGDETGLTQVLHASYGVVDNLEIGLTYGFGLTRLAAKGMEKGYEAGKAFSVDAAYALLPKNLALTLSVPFYTDPFAMSVTLGAPFRFAFNDKWAIFGGGGLIDVKIVKIPVEVANPEFNITTLDKITGENQPEPDGNVKLQLGTLYQAQPHLAGFVTFDLRAPDFSGEKAAYALFAGGTWTWKNKLDVSARAGWASLEQDDAVTVSVNTAFRL